MRSRLIPCFQASNAVVNFANEKAYVEFDGTTTLPEELVRSIEKAGFHIAPQSVPHKSEE